MDLNQLLQRSDLPEAVKTDINTWKKVSKKINQANGLKSKTVLNDEEREKLRSLPQWEAQAAFLQRRVEKTMERKPSNESRTPSPTPEPASQVA